MVGYAMGMSDLTISSRQLNKNPKSEKDKEQPQNIFFI
ncbi:hypothetical protein VRK_26320 [Vibrio sp. MEBiC08052]|nr:hypothetical protein VRK_26320 [Vibrio sp. MEBiC08052]